MVDAGAGGGRSSPLQGRSCKKFYSRTPSHASLTSLVKFHTALKCYVSRYRTRLAVLRTDRRGRGSYMWMYSISNSRKRFPAIPFELVHVFIIQRSTFVFSAFRRARARVVSASERARVYRVNAFGSPPRGGPPQQREAVRSRVRSARRSCNVIARLARVTRRVAARTARAVSRPRGVRSFPSTRIAYHSTASSPARDFRDVVNTRRRPRSHTPSRESHRMSQPSRSRFGMKPAGGGGVTSPAHITALRAPCDGRL